MSKANQQDDAELKRRLGRDLIPSEERWLRWATEALETENEGQEAIIIDVRHKAPLRPERSLAMQVNHLRIEIAGMPINDYRVVDCDLEFRVLDRNGRAFF